MASENTALRREIVLALEEGALTLEEVVKRLHARFSAGQARALDPAWIKETHCLQAIESLIQDGQIVAPTFALSDEGRRFAVGIQALANG